MKVLSLVALLGIAALAGCSTTSTNNANMRGANTNTGYTTNSETNARPTMPANVTNISPPSMGNTTNTNTRSNGSMNANMNSNTRRP